MERRNLATFQMLENVVRFGTTYVKLFPENSLAIEAFAEISSALARWSAEMAADLSGEGAIRSSSEIRAAAREAIPSGRRSALPLPAMEDGTRAQEIRRVLRRPQGRLGQARSLKVRS